MGIKRSQFAKIKDMKIDIAAIYLDTAKQPSLNIAKALSKTLLEYGIKHYVLEYSATPRDIKEGTSLMLCIGGDGTLLKAARMAAGKDMKIVGINSGHLGFLSAAEACASCDDLIDSISNDGFFEQKRLLLSVSVMRSGAEVFSSSALNECVIKTCEARAMSLNVTYGQSELKEYFGDGLIVATPTGSTAYSLAAGGPIVYPTLDVFILTPICPHTLTQRPLVLPASEPIKINVSLRKHGVNVGLSLDGQVNFNISYEDTVNIERSVNTVSILFPKDYNFFKALTSKLKWGSR